MRKEITLILAALLITVVAALAIAQSRPEPRILSGPDVGFRVEGMDATGKPTGSLVVRINGQWMEVGLEAKLRPAR